MAYTIYKSDGTILTTITDGTYDNTTSLNLPGKNLYNFGTLQNENFFWLLENFSSSTPPARPTTGQLWYNTSSQIVQVYNGTSWLSLASVTGNASLASSLGNLYFNTVTDQLSVYNGVGLSLIGPEAVSGFGTTKFSSTSIIDTNNISYPVIECYINNEVVAIISSTAFNINSSTPITGFSSLVRGINLKNGASTDFTLFGQSNTSQNAYLLSNATNSTFIAASTASNASTIVERDGSGNINAVGVNATSITGPGTIYGIWSVNDGLIPATNLGSSLGSSANIWSSLYAQTVNSTNINSSNVNFNGYLIDRNGTNIYKFDNDPTLSSNSNSYLPTQQAVKTYVDTSITNIISAVSGFTPNFGFITPQTIFDLTGDNMPFLSGTQDLGANTSVLNIPWTTYNVISQLSGVGIPANTKSVILEVHYTAHWIGDGVASNNYNTAVILGRIDSTTGNGSTWPWSDCYLLTRAATSEYKYWNQTVNMVQVVMPLRQTAEVGNPTAYPAGSFDYSIPARPSNGGGMEAVAIRIVGYYA